MVLVSVIITDISWASFDDFYVRMGGVLVALLGEEQPFLTFRGFYLNVIRK